MRGCAALLVLGYHIWTEFGVMPIFGRAYLAVDFFFMLSGFVMARTYEARLQDGRIGARTFLAARYRRLWAPIAIGTVVGWLFLVLSGNPPSMLAAVAGLTMVPYLGFAKPYLLNRPAWSIFFELAANSLHAVLLGKIGTRAVLAIALTSAVILGLYCMKFGAITVGFRSSDFWAGMPRVLMAYCLGVALWRLRMTSRFPPGAATLLLIAVLLFVPRGLAWDMAFVLLLCPALILAGAQPFGGRFAALLGALSFPLYAVHFPVLQMAMLYGMGPLAATGGAIAAALLVGMLVDRRLIQSARQTAR